MICVSAGEKDFKKTLDIALNYSFAEIRLDLIESVSKVQAEIIFRSHNNLIAAYRKSPEAVSCSNSGTSCCTVSDLRRLDILETAVNSGAKYLDADMENTDKFINEASVICREKAVFIISFHDYEKTPALNIIRRKIERAESFKADIIKIACAVNNRYELENLLSIPLTFSDKKIVVAGMGNLGTRARILAPFAGSLFTYASSAEGKATAPGQADYYTLEKEHRRLADVW